MNKRKYIAPASVGHTKPAFDAAVDVDLRPGAVNWVGDPGPGSVYDCDEPEESWFDKIPKLVIFIWGVAIGSFIPVVLWHVPW